MSLRLFWNGEDRLIGTWPPQPDTQLAVSRQEFLDDLVVVWSDGSEVVAFEWRYPELSTTYPPLYELLTYLTGGAHHVAVTEGAFTLESDVLPPPWPRRPSPAPLG